MTVVEVDLVRLGLYARRTRRQLAAMIAVPAAGVALMAGGVAVGALFVRSRQARHS